MFVFVQITNVGADAGPFTLTANNGATVLPPNTFTAADLIAGQTVILSNSNATIITITSSGLCTNSIPVVINPLTTTTTTAAPCATAICGQTFEGFGYLYNWYAIFGAGAQTNAGRNLGGIVNINQPYTDERNQWVVPSDDDWNGLIGFIDPAHNPTVNGFQSPIAGGKLKTNCITPFTQNNGVWNLPNSGATNEYLWAGIPGGSRNFDGSFSNINNFGYWWSSTEFNINPDQAWYRSLVYNLSGIGRSRLNKIYGLSIRLVRPATTAELFLSDGTTSNQNPLLPHYIGNSRTYITVKIGNQVWTAQNLVDTTYNNSLVIPEVTNDATWNGLTTGARCSYNNASITPDQGQIALCGVPI